MAGKVVSTKLVLDDEASQVLKHIGAGFEQVADHAKTTAGEFLRFARDAAAVAVGVNIGNIAESFKSLGEEAFGAATQVEDQISGLAGMLSISDRTGASLVELRETAANTKDALEEMSIAAGADADAVIEGFGEMAERTDYTREELMGLTEEMVYAGRAVSGGFASIAQGFQSLELGMARASNPIVLMIKQAGLMQGSAKQVANELTKMAQAGHIEDVIKLGDQAISRMAEKMRNVAPGFAEISASLRTMRENVFESLGEPILHALSPALQDLQHYLLVNKDAIQAYAKEAGEKVGEWVTDAAHLFRDGFFYLKDHAAEIKDAIETAATAIREAFEFILAHKTELAIAFGAGPAASLLGRVGGMVGGAVGAAGAGAAFGGVRSALAVTEGAGAAARIGSVGSALAAMISPAGAAALALGGVALALNQARQLADEYDDGSKDLAAYTEALRAMGSDSDRWTKETTANMDQMREKALLLASSLGHGAAEVQAAYDNAVRSHEALEGVLGPARNAADAIDRINTSLGGQKPDLTALEGIQDATTQFDNVINAADAAHNDAAINAAAKMIVGSKSLQGALLAGADLTEGGFTSLISAIDKLSPELAAKMKGVMGFSLENACAEVPKINQTVHFSGGQSFQIKQDFRDADPDRIAALFRRDILNTATNRLSAVTATPFGT